MNDEEFQTSLTKMFDLKMFSSYTEVVKSFAENINQMYITEGLCFHKYNLYLNLYSSFKRKLLIIFKNIIQTS